MTVPKPAPPPEPLIVYVDGFNLYWGLHDRFGRRHLWLDLVALARTLRRKSRLVAVKYFTASVVNEPDAQARQDRYISALQDKYPGIVSVTMGRYQSKPIQCRGCGNGWDHREEKETDVNIAVNLVADAARESMRAALIISADSDLAPAVRTARDINPRLFVAAAFPPKRHSSELKRLMPASFNIGDREIRRSQLPQTFTAAGRQHSCPPKWS